MPVSLDLCGFSAVLYVWQIQVLLFETCLGIFFKSIFDPKLTESCQQFGSPTVFLSSMNIF